MFPHLYKEFMLRGFQVFVKLGSCEPVGIKLHPSSYLLQKDELLCRGVELAHSLGKMEMDRLALYRQQGEHCITLLRRQMTQKVNLSTTSTLRISPMNMSTN